MGDGLNYEETFINQFGSIGDISYQMVNLGVQAFGSDQSLLALKRHWKKFNTKVVVYTFIEQHIMRNGNNDRRLLDPNAWFLGTKPLFDYNNDNELYLKKRPCLYKDYLNSFLLDLIKIKMFLAFLMTVLLAITVKVNAKTDSLSIAGLILYALCLLTGIGLGFTGGELMYG